MKDYGGFHLVLLKMQYACNTDSLTQQEVGCGFWLLEEAPRPGQYARTPRVDTVSEVGGRDCVCTTKSLLGGGVIR